MNLTVGTMLQGGKYILNQALGGVQSLTFKATHTPQQRSVILKTLNLQSARDAADLKRQWMEKVRALSQCRHPALTAVLDWFEEDGLPFVVMDCVPGQSLGDRVTSRGPLAESEALQYVRQVGSALSLLHRQGVVHQDLKPSNLIQPIGANLVVLVDFGLVEQVGTPGFAGQEYAAIEQFQSKPVTAATDIYALSASLYFLLTGQVPIAAPLRHHTPLVPLRQLRPQVSPTLESAVLAGLELNPTCRPQTIAAWFSLLEGHTSANAASNGRIADPGSYPAPSPAAIELPSLTLPPSNGNLPPKVPSTVPTSAPGGVSGHTPPSAFVTQAMSPNGHGSNGHGSNGHGSNGHVPNGPVALNGRAVPPSPPARRRFPRAFVVVAALAGSIGLGLGLMLRVSGGTGPGSSFFHTEQAFPKLKDSTPATPAVSEKFSPAPPDPPLTRTYDSAAPVSPTSRSTSPADRVDRVDRPIPVEADPTPVQPKAKPKIPVSDPAPAPSPVPSVSAPPPPAPVPSSDPAPSIAPAPASSPAPANIPPPPAVPSARSPKN